MFSRSDYRLTLTIYTVGCKAPISKLYYYFVFKKLNYNFNKNISISICNYNLNFN